MDDVQMNFKGMDDFIRAIKGPLPYIKVGILGAKTHRHTQGPSNATIGAVHEYGAPSKGIKPRSFLRMPLTEKLGPKLGGADFFNPDTLKRVIKERSIFPWMKEIAAVAEGVVTEAFASGGYGQWSPWKNPKERLKHSNAGMLLVDTKQLMDSITSEVTSG